MPSPTRCGSARASSAPRSASASRSSRATAPPAEDLTRHADARCTRSSAPARTPSASSTPSSTAAIVTASRALENDLRGAVARGELDLHYQPQVSLARATSSAWRPCCAGTIRAWARFRPRPSSRWAEEVGLIGEISNWVLETACAARALAGRRRRRAAGVDQPVGLATSSAAAWSARIRACLDRHGVAPECLEWRSPRA